MATYQQNPAYRPGYAGTIDQAAYDAGLRSHMLRVYNYLASGLALSGIVAVLCFTVPAVQELFFRISPQGRLVGVTGLFWVAVLAPIGIILAMSFMRNMSLGVMQGLYWLMVALMGVSLSMLLYRYTGASVARAFFITSAAFAALSLYGYTTKKDLSGVGKFLFMGLIGLILASVVNMIWPSGTMTFVISVATVLIFSGLIAYDTQNIKEQYAESWGTDVQERVAIMGAVSLYLNFVNLFQAIMALTGASRDE